MMALLPLCHQISEGFDADKPATRTAFVAVDISKAFDTFDITLLLQQISRSELRHNLVRWLSTILHGRKAACVYQGCRSRFRTVHIGVPQGSVLSPALFNHFTSNFPEVSGSKSSFADDFTIGKSDLDLKVIDAALNKDLVRFSNGLGVSDSPSVPRNPKLLSSLP
jgi:retron-type reverse transcriptase